jgi:hypothetical protein
MKKRIWIYLSVILIIIVVIEGTILLGLLPKYINAAEVSIGLDPESLRTGVVFDAGYIANAETAAEIGSAIIDCGCIESGKTVFPWEKGAWAVYVEYDPVSRLWLVRKGYFLNNGAVVILEQDTGRVVSFLFQK